MSRFVQLHILTSYAASNLNRDDLGAPKSMMLGNAARLRVSSQSLKRAWRTSDVFQAALGGAHLGTRTKELGRKVFAALVNGVPLAAAWKDESAAGTLNALKETKAVEIARAVAGVFGKLKSESKADKDPDPAKKRVALLESLEIEQLAHLSPEELEEAARLTEACRASGAVPEKDALDLLRHRVKAADIAMFGRMLAASARFNVEAAVQVAHALTVHKAVAEDDFFTAVDDLNKDDQGAGHMGVLEFGAGVFYLYVCVDRSLLAENLCNDAALAAKALEALVRAACTVAPSGKQSSFASRAYAFYALAEKGDAQPRGLSLAFLNPVEEEDMGLEAIKKLESTRESMERVYGQTAQSECFNALEGKGTLDALVRFAAE
ncbi:CRISPR system Cascade subunit CasC [Fundidesulfovibrio magnetotacticus]|uniref:CRISPR system Cascade subunit CasC n=1 Tax=Fundidesulfovibrio magnetotacticus TaxID=2730080 RepID=A0A6V8LKS9_9BACT|nr:type I-E CRISPR-associated protein Cas7/Cse4/CasC [Fundidesulfovibrio magnetotacticus]GFK93302.1 CRISPR system Cascade subunit CasC [Fundidesulfovibrio magnetotacticus]